MDTKELERKAAHLFHLRPLDASEVNNQPLGFVNIEREVVGSATTFTSSLYGPSSLLVMLPIIVVSSPDLMMVLELYFTTQS